MSKISKKVAIVLFNLGGPDKLSSVRPFLFNLFYDPAIIRLPNPLRWIVAKTISILRDKIAQKIYSHIGGKSSILDQTQDQKKALSERLKEDNGIDFEIFIVMRYWHPRISEIVEDIEEYSPDEVILLPLYPQFSTTTTGSSVKEFREYWSSNIPVKTICCYSENDDFINAHISLIKESLNELNDKTNYRILFSAHSLPVSIIEAGDPYQNQIEKTVEKIVSRLGINNLDYELTYQSRATPVEWLKPSTEIEIELAGKEQKNLIIVPVAFVSEHVETLVELDIEYKEIAEKYKVEYIRVPTLGINNIFIEGLSKMIKNLVKDDSILSDEKCKCGALTFCKAV